MSKPYLFLEQAPKLHKQWSTFNITRNETQLHSIATRLVAHKPKYQEVEHDTGVPWYVVALIHEREASGSFAASIAQGDLWNAVSTHEPRGRGPFESFREAAYDALVTLKGYDKLKGQWTIERILYTLEPYNGLGYFWKGIPSPYVWSCTDQYDPPNGPGGKYVRDGVFDASVVDKQCGVAAILRTMMTLDPTITPKSLYESSDSVGKSDPLIVGGIGIMLSWFTSQTNLLIGVVSAVFTVIAVGYLMYRRWKH